MGAGGSTPRRISVQEDELTGMVRVSESVAKRLLGQPDGNDQTTEKLDERKQKSPKGLRKSKKTKRYDDAEVQKVEKYYKEKINNLEKQNADLYKQTQEQFVQAVEEVEKKFINTTSSPICQDLQNEVIKCYNANPGKTLNCSPQVTAFVECVQKQREKILIKKG